MRSVLFGLILAAVCAGCSGSTSAGSGSATVTVTRTVAPAATTQAASPQPVSAHRSRGRFVAVQSPTGNIHCVWVSMNAGAFVACETLNNRRVVVLPTVGGGFAPAKTVQLPAGTLLSYNERFSRYGITCTSRFTGFTCRNPGGDRIFVSRASARVSTPGQQSAAFPGFQSPTGNIRCIYLGQAGTTFVACQTENNHTTVALPSDGNPFRVNDKLVFPAERTLAYGQSWARGGFSCTSETQGVICENPLYASFAINRSVSRLEPAPGQDYSGGTYALPPMSSGGESYWTTPPPAYPGYSSPPGGYNSVGCPRDEWTNGYFRSDGTYVSGYWHNSPTDGCGGG